MSFSNEIYSDLVVKKGVRLYFDLNQIGVKIREVNVNPIPIKQVVNQNTILNYD